MKPVHLYHGTVWDRPFDLTAHPVDPFIVYDNISAEHNDLGVFFVSDNDKVSEFFSEIKQFDDENQIQACVSYRAVLDNALELRCEAGRSVSFNGGGYDYSCNESRKELYSLAREFGYDALVMKNDYTSACGEPGDDIAVFNTRILTPAQVKLKINQRWTHYQDINAAKSIFAKWAARQLEPCSFEPACNDMPEWPDQRAASY